MGMGRIVETQVHFDRIVSAFVFILQFESQESQVDILTDGGFDYPVTVFFVVVVVIAVFSVWVEVLHTSWRL